MMEFYVSGQSLKMFTPVTAANKITFYAKAKPTVSIPLQIRCIRK